MDLATVNKLLTTTRSVRARLGLTPYGLPLSAPLAGPGLGTCGGSYNRRVEGFGA
jgi:hypothetical protein